MNCEKKKEIEEISKLVYENTSGFEISVSPVRKRP